MPSRHNIQNLTCCICLTCPEDNSKDDDNIIVCSKCNIKTHSRCYKEWIDICNQTTPSFCCLNCNTDFQKTALEDHGLATDAKGMTRQTSNNQPHVSQPHVFPGGFTLPLTPGEIISPCPNCGILINKNGGCLEMRCLYCGTTFHWLSRQIFQRNNWNKEKRRAYGKDSWGTNVLILVMMIMLFVWMIMVVQFPIPLNHDSSSRPFLPCNVWEACM
jgi:hypothetical protein